ncbi:hypothetical protein B0H11DRAFT_2224261 [Mycena galericulata]|nr:hypothetical protein B0H11DRAFT_2224261 [Mycena galericulata]
MPVPRTRSNSKSSAPQPDAPASAPTLATPAEVATTGYPGKRAEKGKAVPKGLHFKNGTGNTYTGSSVPKGKQRAPTHSTSPASSTVSSNAFGPLAVFQEGQSDDEDEHTLEEQLARDLVGADELNALYPLPPTSNLQPPSPPPESASRTEESPSAVPTKSFDAIKEIARKLAGRPSTPVPAPSNTNSGPTLPWSAAVVAAATSPFLAPMSADAAPNNGSLTNATATNGATTSGLATTDAIPPVVAAPTIAPSAPASAAAAPAVSAPIITTAPTTTITAAPPATVSTVTGPLVGTSPTAVSSGDMHPATAVPSTSPVAPPANQTTNAASPAATVTTAPAATFATVAAAAPSAPTTRSSTRRAQAAAAAPANANVVPTAPPAPAPAAATAPVPAPMSVAPAAAAPTIAANVAHTATATAPAPTPAPPTAIIPAAAPAVAANVAHALAPPGPPIAPAVLPPAALIPHQGLVAPVAVPTGVAPGVNGAPVAAAGLQCTPPPPGGFHPVYGWNHKNIESNTTARQAVGWRNMQDDRVLIYEYNGSHHSATTPPSDFLERAKNALVQHFNCPAPLIGPAEAESAPALYEPPFLYMLSRLPLQHLQTLINQGCWSFPTVTFYVMPHPPEISPFLFTLDGLLYGPSQQDALEVANLVAAEISGDTAAQAFLSRVHDNYPATANPMQHFISTLRVSPMELSNPGGSVRTAWTVTAQPPTTNVDEHNTWIATVSNIDFPTVMYYVGKAMSPPLFCNGCKSLGHPTGRCPTLKVPGIHVTVPTTPTQPPANTESNPAEGSSRGRGGGSGRARAAKKGRGSQARRPARGRGF